MLRTLLLPILLCISLSIFAQGEGTIRGFVYEQSNGEPVIFTNVYLSGTSIGAATDVNGFFQITKIPSGDYTLMVTYLGYDTLRKAVSVSGAEIQNLKLFLNKSAINIGEIVISADKQEDRNQVKIGVDKITPKQIQSLPSQGGEADLAQYLQVLPGVVFTGDQGGQLYIRGGSPVQNMVLLDGMIIYNPFHSIGLFSVFDTDILRNADVYSGGFDAEYGGRVSSVMDVTTRDGNKQRISGKLSASTFGAKALIEGPIKKQSERGGSSSFILSAKQSYLDQTSKNLYSYVNDGDGLPFVFTDLYGKLSLNGANGSKVNFFGFNYRDEVSFQALSDLEWNTFGVGTSFLLIPGSSATIIQGNFAFSDYQIELDEQNLPPRSSRVNGFNFGLDFKYFNGDNEFKYGFDIIGMQTDFSFFNTSGLSFTQKENTTELGGYFTYKIKKKRLVVEPSMRAHLYASLSEVSLEPRIGAKYNVTDDFRLKGAAGRYSQNLIAANSDRDVVNLFYGFLSGPEELPDTYTKEDGEVIDRTSRLQFANHYVVGFEYDLSRYFEVNVEAYIKDFTQIVNTNRNQIFENTAENADVPDVFKSEFIIETGLAQGVDVVMKYTRAKYDLWAVYSLGKSTRWDGVQTYAPIFDRRHNVNLVGTYRAGKENDLEFSVRWNFGSAFPFTPNAGFAQSLDFANGVDSDFISENPDQVFNLLGDLNSQRLAAYHRMDFNVKKYFEIREHQVLEINLGATNIYNRENIFYIARDSFDFVYQLPILPSLGASYTF